MEDKVFYYKCENCQSEWNGVKKLEVCPFCNTKVAIQNSNFTKIEEALSYIFSAYGIDVVNENNRLVALLSDYAPTLERERKLIRVAQRLGIYSDLITVNKDGKSSQEFAINKAVSKLHNDAFMDIDIAREVVGWIIPCLRWQIQNVINLETEASSIIKVSASSSSKIHSMINIPTFMIGDIIEFGNYPFGENGEIKPITWRVMDSNDNKILLWSEFCVDSTFYAAQRINKTWEYSSLRSWLKSRFMNKAFTRDEMTQILINDTESSFNPNSKISSGLITTDKIFIPSYEDIKKYGGNLIVPATPYAKNQGVFCDEYGAFWWLRTPGNDGETQMCVSHKGVLIETGSYCYLVNRGVRPALWVDLDRIK